MDGHALTLKLILYLILLATLFSYSLSALLVFALYKLCKIFITPEHFADEVLESQRRVGVAKRYSEMFVMLENLAGSRETPIGFLLGLHQECENIDTEYGLTTVFEPPPLLAVKLEQILESRRHLTRSIKNPK